MSSAVDARIEEAAGSHASLNPRIAKCLRIFPLKARTASVEFALKGAMLTEAVYAAGASFN